MIRANSALVSALVSAFVLLAAGLWGAPSARASTTSLCRYANAWVSGGRYVVQNNEWGSSAHECLRLGRGTAFTVASSAMANRTDRAPGGYPSVYAGCHWGRCSTGGLSARPVRVSGLRNGVVTSSWATAQPYRKGWAYDVAYDIWVNRTPRTGGEPDGSEVMIWLNHRGHVQPAGRLVARDVRIGLHVYNIWYRAPSARGGGDTVSYVLDTKTYAVSGLDIGKVIRNAVARHYTSASWYLIDVEAGFELWRGGAGVATRSFSVQVR